MKIMDWHPLDQWAGFFLWMLGSLSVLGLLVAGVRWLWFWQQDRRWDRRERQRQREWSEKFRDEALLRKIVEEARTPRDEPEPLPVRPPSPPRTDDLMLSATVRQRPASSTDAKHHLLVTKDFPQPIPPRVPWKFRGRTEIGGDAYLVFTRRSPHPYFDEERATVRETTFWKAKT